ncbi:MAPEG family protein [Arsenicitalea aurantiaca]|nr:MAPEG family protein [Arsenicitalea aurantiaca]
MLLIIFIVLLLVFIQNVIPGYLLTQQVGPEMQMGARDNLPEPTPALGRARRALANLHETLPIFLTLAILVLVLGEDGWLPVLGGVVYIAGRIGHFYCYMKALSPWRSIAFTISLVGMGLVALPLMPHLWS